MLNQGSIARRIALSHLVVILLTGLLMGAAFWLLLHRHLEQAARDSLQQDALNVAGIVSGLPPEVNGQGRMMRGMFTYHMLGRVIQGEYLLVNRRGLVLESSIEQIPTGSVLATGVVDKIVTPGIYNGRVTLGNEQYVAAGRYLDEQANRGSTVLLLTRVAGLEKIHNELLILFLISLSLALIVALGLTVLLARHISRPLKLLQEKAHRVAERNFGWQVEVNSRDELGELGQAINAMDEKLADYDRAQKQFFQNASHELKSPLMSILGYSEGVRDGVFKGAEARHALNVVARETGRLKNIVDELVFLGGHGNPSQMYHFEEVDLQEVLEQAVDSQQVLAAEKNVALNLDALPEVILRADGEKLVRVFINLVANAVRHAVKEVQIKADIQPGAVHVTVRDDGIGFTGEDLQHLWERFYKGARGGSGLGLPIARAIVEEHDGSIQAGNVPGGGAQIEVVLPVKK